MTVHGNFSKYLCGCKSQVQKTPVPLGASTKFPVKRELCNHKENSSELHSDAEAAKRTACRPAGMTACVRVHGSAFSLTSTVQPQTQSRAHRLLFMWFTS
ncbi:uncharacterized protein V6R79_026197 [Siganus canaliculatus]